MIRNSFIHTLFSLLVMFSLLVPSVVPFLNFGEETMLIIDFAEEEQKKENKKELGEKEVFFQELSDTQKLLDVKSNKLHYAYLEHFIEVTTEIFLPPPEHNS